MDVQAVATSAAPWPVTGTIGLPPSPVEPTPGPTAAAPSKVTPPDSGGQANNQTTLPATSSDAAQKAAGTPVASTVAKLFDAQAQNVAVSFQIGNGLDDIVTVFTDKTTGKVIVQFPSETLIALAKLFDHLDGGVVNKKV
jgi:uncharacterized FlaG/YvyC family protein